MFITLLIADEMEINLNVSTVKLINICVAIQWKFIQQLK